VERSEVAQLLTMLSVAYPGSKISADEMTLSLWHEMLSDLPGEVVGAATKRMIAKLRFPPSVADVRQAVAEAVTEAQGVVSAGEAWSRVKRAIAWYGWQRGEEARKALGEDIWRAVCMVGGWQYMCLTDDDESTRSAQFERRYTAMQGKKGDMIQIPESVREDMARLVGALTAMLTGGDAKRLEGGNVDDGDF